jgi:hypothetical protein
MTNQLVNTNRLVSTCQVPLEPMIVAAVDADTWMM